MLSVGCKLEYLLFMILLRIPHLYLLKICLSDHSLEPSSVFWGHVQLSLSGVSQSPENMFKSSHGADLQTGYFVTAFAIKGASFPKAPSVRNHERNLSIEQCGLYTTLLGGGIYNACTAETGLKYILGFTQKEVKSELIYWLLKVAVLVSVTDDSLKILTPFKAWFSKWGRDDEEVWPQEHHETARCLHSRRTSLRCDGFHVVWWVMFLIICRSFANVSPTPCSSTYGFTPFIYKLPKVMGRCGDTSIYRNWMSCYW